MQKHVNLVDLVKSFPTNILLQNLASIQQRTSLIEFDHLAEKSENGSISNLSTKVNPLAKRNPLRYSDWTPLAFGMAEELLDFADEKRPIFLQIVRENTFSSEVFTDKSAAVAYVRDHDESRRLR